MAVAQTCGSYACGSVRESNQEALLGRETWETTEIVPLKMVIFHSYMG